MPISVVCSECSAKLNAPDTAAGKKVQCPKCSAPIVVPALDADESDVEVVDEEDSPKPAAKKATTKAKPKPPPADDDHDEDEEKPRNKRQAESDDNDEDEEKEDDRPKKKKKKKKKQAAGTSMTRNLVMGGVLLVLLVVVGFVFFGKTKDKDTASKDKDTAGKTDSPNTPGGPNNPNPGPGPGSGPITTTTTGKLPNEKPYPFDKSKISFDPTKPQATLTFENWPHRLIAPNDARVPQFGDKVVELSGRVLKATESPIRRNPIGGFEDVNDGTGPYEPWCALYIADPTGDVAYARIYAAELLNWNVIRPGLLVRVVGMGKFKSAGNKTDKLQFAVVDAVVVGTSGEADPPFTAETFAAAFQKDSKPFLSTSVPKSFVLTATVAEVEAKPEKSLDVRVKLAIPGLQMSATLSNRRTIDGNLPKVGEPITILGSVAGSLPTKIGMYGIYIPK